MAASLRRIYVCCKYGIPELLKSEKGIIINQVPAMDFNDESTVISGALCALHSAKSAILALTSKIAYAYGPSKIRACAIQTGAMERFPGALNENLVQAPEILTEKIPLRRKGTPEDIADAALFLASENAGFITGTSVIVDGGYAFTHRWGYP
jgi:NAD(P)-dependent dehydrogenase (short-subunit alcohol dehydrogenase family)